DSRRDPRIAWRLRGRRSGNTGDTQKVWDTVFQNFGRYSENLVHGAHHPSISYRQGKRRSQETHWLEEKSNLELARQYPTEGERPHKSICLIWSRIWTWTY